MTQFWAAFGGAFLGIAALWWATQCGWTVFQMKPGEEMPDGILLFLAVINLALIVTA